MAHVFALPARTRAPQFSGHGYIAGETPGLVTVNSVAAGRELEVRHRVTRQVVAITFAKPDGTYRIDGLDPNQEFDLIGRDYTGTYNDVIVSRVTPQPY
jgi:hypothetical protein